MKKNIALIFLMVLSVMNGFSQHRNSVWCFGDSALINFGDTSNLVIGSSGMDGRGSCVSISDSSGQLQFYAFTRSGVNGNSALIFNANHLLMQNGDSIVGEGWYQELVIIPNPKQDSTYYLFCIGVIDFGLYYSLIDMRLNGGLGAVTVKNIQLQSFEQVDCINAVKHGNGRDWWLFFRKSDFSILMSNNDWYSYLITPDGIQNFSVQTIGVQNRTNNGHICFSPTADKMVFINLLGVVELFDFDRCSGLLSNSDLIEADLGFPYPFTWSCEFSPDASKLYTTTNKDTSYLYQYDLNAANISLSKDTLWATNNPEGAIGALKLAPDNKIYLASWYNNGFSTNYPYPDSMYNMYNMNLSVINQPDSLGSACDFQPYSFYLGGKRTYVGLPNNPDYDMPALIGSSCDSLVGISEQQPLAISTPQLHIFYHPTWQTAFINASNLKGTKGTMEIFDMQGKLILKEDIHIQNGYYTRDLNMIGMTDGMYFVRIFTAGQKLEGKIVKY